MEGLYKPDTRYKTKMFFVICVNSIVIMQRSSGNKHIRYSGTMTYSIGFIQFCEQPVNVSVYRNQFKSFKEFDITL